MDLYETELGRLSQQVRERAVAVAALGELRSLALHGVLEARGEDGAVTLALKRVDRLEEQLVAVVLVLAHLSREIRHAA